MSLSQAHDLFFSALMVSLPAFGWLVTGMLLHRVGALPTALNDRISDLSFRYGLPVMLFAGSAQVDYAGLAGARYLLAGVLATVLTLGVSWWYSRWRGHPRAIQGIVVQAGFRSNLAIVGVALTYSAYGEQGPILAALPIALMTVLYNILAVWVLDATLGTATTVGTIARGVVRNPLIIGIAAGAVLSLSGLPQPALVATTGSFLSAFFLPLVLICIGASMNVSQLYRAGSVCWEASMLRLCVGPALAVLIGLMLGVEGELLGVLFLLVASPVAASSYVMVVAARGDGVLAANIVVLTSLLSIVTVTLGFFLLSLFGLVGTLG